MAAVPGWARHLGGAALSYAKHGNAPADATGVLSPFSDGPLYLIAGDPMRQLSDGRIGIVLSKRIPRGV